MQGIRHPHFLFENNLTYCSYRYTIQKPTLVYIDILNLIQQHWVTQRPIHSQIPMFIHEIVASKHKLQYMHHMTQKLHVNKYHVLNTIQTQNSIDIFLIKLCVKFFTVIH